ncbi:MAG: cytochrome c-type biogenesis protein CcmH [Geminicoccaceae bacterium]|nr:cytochrome c-type biogenesis protein CcmH [Geminicoccaceae bacterium]MCB9944266.1 cytochrome c-type biogenesis protein CcmH [Geminicoccaceae bacterium]
MRFCIILLLVLSVVLPARAGVTPDEVLADPALEMRARELGRELRCLVCQNQSIDDSDASLAHDLRVLVRERLVAGDTDQQVRDYLVARYGEFVLLEPPVQASTWLLWGGPFVILILGAILVFVFVRRRPAGMAEPEPLDDSERARLQQLNPDQP